MYININQMKKLRIALHLSKAELARRVGVSRMYITKLERNESTPSITVILKISKELDSCPYDLINLCGCCFNKNCPKGKFF
ncbi:MAG: helix-turn-helix transcriptional regulator [Clostridiaceae bacterium]